MGHATQISLRCLSQCHPNRSQPGQQTPKKKKKKGETIIRRGEKEEAAAINHTHQMLRSHGLGNTPVVCNPKEAWEIQSLIKTLDA